jgi:hypothetical protein
MVLKAPYNNGSVTTYKNNRNIFDLKWKNAPKITRTIQSIQPKIISNKLHEKSPMAMFIINKLMDG